MIDKLAAQDDMQQKTEKSDWTFRILLRGPILARGPGPWPRGPIGKTGPVSISN